MLQKKTLIWTVIAAVFIGGIVYFSFVRKPKTEYVTENAKISDLKETVSVSGTLKASDTVLLNFESTGKIGSVDVRVGEKVGKGDIIGTLDNTGLQLAVDQARANLEKARADAGANSDTIRSADVEVENAEKFLEDTKRLNDRNIAAAEQKVSDTKAYLDDAQSYYDQVKDDNGTDSSTTKLAKLSLDTAEANYEQAKDALDVADQTADLSKTSAENKLESAKAALDSAESDFVEASKNATVAAQQAAFETAINNLGKAALRSPANGTIKAVNFRTGEVIGAASSKAFAELISFDFILEARVPESDIAKVKISQKGSVVFDAFSADEKFDADVISIDPSATVVQDVVDYVVKLAMSGDDLRYKDGMSADIDLLVAEKKKVLVIPERAVREQNGKRIVQVLENGKPVDREVRTGMKGDEGMIEVLNGLQEGDPVITSTK